MTLRNLLPSLSATVDGVTYKWHHDGAAQWSWFTNEGLRVRDTLVPSLNRHLPALLPSLRQAAGERGLVDALEAIERALRPTESVKGTSRGESHDEHQSPFNNAALRDWFFAAFEPCELFPRAVFVHGAGPFSESEFCECLTTLGVDSTIADESSDPDVLVVGRSEWSEEVLDHIVDNRAGRVLRVYTQEMLLAFIASDLDPLADRHIALAFARSHPALDFLSEGWPGWVETVVPLGRGSGAQADLTSLESPLHALGYRVGATGKAESERRSILDRAFKGAPASMASWGRPASGEGLRHIADHIAWLCRRHKKRVDSDKDAEAIRHWESDLVWLKATFYHGHLTFRWPGTDTARRR